MAQAPLTSWDNVRKLFGENAPEQDNAPVTFDFLIKGASRMIRRETGRRFTKPRATNTIREFVVSRGGTVYLDEMLKASDIISIEGPAGMVATADWTYEPEDEDPDNNLGGWLHLESEMWPYDLAKAAPEHDGFFTRNMHPPPGAQSDWEGAVIKVTGNWGYTEFPEDIDLLTARTVQVWWDTNVVNYNEGEGGTVEIPDRLPQMVLSALRNYKKPKKGAGVLA